MTGAPLGGAPPLRAGAASPPAPKKPMKAAVESGHARTSLDCRGGVSSAAGGGGTGAGDAPAGAGPRWGSAKRSDELDGAVRFRTRSSHSSAVWAASNRTRVPCHPQRSHRPGRLSTMFRSTRFGSRLASIRPRHVGHVVQELSRQPAQKIWPHGAASTGDVHGVRHTTHSTSSGYPASNSNRVSLRTISGSHK